MTENILITGAAGFIGSHFARHVLEQTAYSVVSLDRLDDAGNLARLAELKQRFPDRLRIVHHDLRAEIKPADLPETFKYIVHMAAGSHVDRSLSHVLQFVQDNVAGTANLLEWARWHQPGVKVLYFSTDEVFGPAPEGVEYSEHSRHEPENHYAATKAGAEALCPAYAHQCKMPIVVTHCCNVYGPMQHGEKFIPLVIGKIKRGEMVQIHARGGVSSSRLYIHVDDVSRATMTVLEKGGVICDDQTGRYNIRPDAEQSNLDVAASIAELLELPFQFELVENPPNRIKPDMRYGISDAKLRALGWAPRVPFHVGLAELVKQAR
jgi:dTDP-glucose 4,6-dehydratase